MKKSLPIIALFSLSIGVTAQMSGPQVEGIYLPIRGTVVEQVWAEGNDVSMDLPETGENIAWDYVSWFIDSGYTLSTNKFETMQPSAAPVGKDVFPTASHAAVYFAQGSQLDSVYSYFRIEADGVYQVGAYKASEDLTFHLPVPELVAPALLQYGMDPIYDTSLYMNGPNFIGDTVYEGQDIEDATVTLYVDRFRTLTVEGYGQLTTAADTPSVTFNDVVMMKERVIEKQRFVLTGVVQFGQFSSTVTHEIEGSTLHYSNFNFLRQVGGGSDMQMSLQTDSAESKVVMGWFAKPLSSGKICGTVKNTDGSAITAGEVYFYEENEKYPKNDLSATIPIDNGTYCVDSAQYGLFRIAAKVDQSLYPNALITYLGDVTKWTENEQVRLLSDSLGGNDIVIQYGQENTGLVTISGYISTNFAPYLPDPQKTTGDPIPGIDVSLEQVPGGVVAQTTTDDEDGLYQFDNVNAQTGDVFKIHVDIPGIPVTQTHTITLSSSEDTVSLLNFEVYQDSIVMVPIPVDTTTTVDSNTAVVEINGSLSGLEVYPNPFTDQLTFNWSASSEQHPVSSLTISTGSGQLVERISVQNQLLIYDTSRLTPGMYFFELKTATGAVGQGKIIKLK